MTAQPANTPEEAPVDEHTFRHIAAVAGEETARVIKKLHDHLFPAHDADDDTETHELNL